MFVPVFRPLFTGQDGGMIPTQRPNRESTTTYVLRFRTIMLSLQPGAIDESSRGSIDIHVKNDKVSFTKASFI